MTVSRNLHSISQETVKGIHPVPLTLLDGSEETAFMLGRNVAWFCTCHDSMPLQGSVVPWSREHPPEPVICPRCHRQYVVFRADEYAQFAQIVEFA